MDNQLEKLHEVELDILRQTLKICDTHNLSYFMLGGTLLGAIRHNGFIPWDDDIDIGLPRPDYDQFIQYAERELVSPYQIHSAMNDKGKYSYYYVRIENTKVKLQKFATKNKTQIPAWIDVFPLDGVPNDDAEMEKWIKRCNFWRRIFSISQVSYTAATSSYRKKRSPLGLLGRRLFLICKIDRLMNTKRLWKRLDKEITKYNYDDCDRIINFCGFWGRKEMFSKDVYGKGTLYQFEDMQLRGPDDYNFVLTQMYGDYMTPPDENSRDHHHVHIIEI